jgi:hypothetical protein
VCQAPCHANVPGNGRVSRRFLSLGTAWTATVSFKPRQLKSGTSASARLTGGLCWIDSPNGHYGSVTNNFPCINSNKDYPCRRPVSVLTYLPRLLSRHHYKSSPLDKPWCQLCQYDKEHFSPLHFHTTDPLQLRQKCFSRFLVTAWKAFFFFYTSYAFHLFFLIPPVSSHCSYSGRFQFL